MSDIMTSSLVSEQGHPKAEGIVWGWISSFSNFANTFSEKMSFSWIGIMLLPGNDKQLGIDMYFVGKIAKGHNL